MNKKIIIISGKQYSGKDVVAGMLNEILPNFKRLPLAKAIKKEYGEIHNLTMDEIEKNKSQYREGLINLGNEKRSQDPDHWIKKVMSEEGNLIVADIRLKHELDTFKKYGAISIRVEASREARAKRGNIVAENDVTETQLDNVTDWDYVIENNRDLDALRKKTEEVAESIKKSF